MVLEKSLKELIEKNKTFFYFLKLCKIPHGSYSEKKISDFIMNWAKERDLQEVIQDQYFNLFIRKKASDGYKYKKPIILQAHLDMVCEKLPEVDHDFKKDSIITKLDNDILSTGNRTTLGADNGVGVAMIMAILENKKLKHPEIDVILTTAEEEDMNGALNIPESWLMNTDRIINLDNTLDNNLIAGSSGGRGAELKIPVVYREKENGEVGYLISVGGLVGGHSGEDIEKGRANANILLARFLKAIEKIVPFTISDINGGSFRLALPREASAVLVISKDDYATVKINLELFEKSMRKIYASVEPNLFINLEEIKAVERVLTKESTKKIIDSILLSPNGIFEKFIDLSVVESSCNLGEVTIKGDFAYLVTEIRGVFEENVEYIYNKILTLGERMGGEVKDFAPYPSWIYKVDSELREIAIKTYEDMFQEKLEVSVIHGGLECGCFSLKIRDMDAISIGPNIWDLHSPYERVSVLSTNKSYNFLLKLLENLE